MTTAPRNNNRKTVIIIIVVALLALLACACILAIGMGWYLTSSDSETEALNIKIKLTQQAMNQITTPIQPGITPQAGSITQGSSGSDACLTGVFPGKTTRDEVLGLWGTPLSEQQEGNYNTLFYQSPIKGQPNTVYLENQVVTYVSVVRGGGQPESWAEVKAKYGEPEHQAFTTYIQDSRYFGYPAQGLAFVADETLDMAYIQDCFVPLTLDEYLTKWGSNLLTEDPFTQ